MGDTRNETDRPVLTSTLGVKPHVNLKINLQLQQLDQFREAFFAHHYQLYPISELIAKQIAANAEAEAKRLFPNHILPRYTSSDAAFEILRQRIANFCSDRVTATLRPLAPLDTNEEVLKTAIQLTLDHIQSSLLPQLRIYAEEEFNRRWGRTKIGNIPQTKATKVVSDTLEESAEACANQFQILNQYWDEETTPHVAFTLFFCQLLIIACAFSEKRAANYPDLQMTTMIMLLGFAKVSTNLVYSVISPSIPSNSERSVRSPLLSLSLPYLCSFYLKLNFKG